MQTLMEKYNTIAMPINCLTLDEGDIKSIITQILFAFPVKEININMAKWITGLDKSHWLKENIFSAIRSAASTVSNVRDSENVAKGIMVCDNVIESRITDIDLGKGSVTINVELENHLFYKILGKQLT